MAKSSLNLSYSDRIPFHENPAAKRLLSIMHRKQTNLCVSLDVTSTKDLLCLAELVGDKCCLIKTHVDILEDFTLGAMEQLAELGKTMDFLIFEDRKFADIGSTVALQYSSGMYKISSWADITNAHAIPGEGIIAGLAKEGKELGRGLVLLSEMSSKGTLATGTYKDQVNAMARAHCSDGFVFGFIAQSRDWDDGSGETDLITLSPGVGLDDKEDMLGQQFRTPKEVILESGSDVIIVGRGIYKDFPDKDKVTAQAERFRQQGWDAYLQRIGKGL